MCVVMCGWVGGGLWVRGGECIMSISVQYSEFTYMWLYHIHECRVAEYASNIHPSQTRNACRMRARVLAGR